jgi:uncharacterized membrane protein (Fun14 family)
MQPPPPPCLLQPGRSCHYCAMINGTVEDWSLTGVCVCDASSLLIVASGTDLGPSPLMGWAVNHLWKQRGKVLDLVLVRLSVGILAQYGCMKFSTQQLVFGSSLAFPTKKAMTLSRRRSYFERREGARSLRGRAGFWGVLRMHFFEMAVIGFPGWACSFGKIPSEFWWRQLAVRPPFCQWHTRF